MRARESAESGNGARRRPRTRPRPRRRVGSAANADVQATAGTADRLDYIADMVRQLKAMAAAADCGTLAALLELAYHEAIRQRRSDRKPGH